MELHALIPVKSLRLAKSRLAENFSEAERSTLVLSMLDHVLETLKSSKEITKIIVVTPDELVEKHVLESGFTVIPEEKPGHNPALTAAAQKENDGEKLLTISADLPLITQEDIHEMITLSLTHDVVLASSKDNGTNALLLAKPLLLPYLFGENSLEKYKKAAKELGLTVAIYQSKTMAFDVDTITDVETFRHSS
jgi:2-phospho-L-lactate/phosphoenolpyruvate guanylyltransferase